MAAPPVAPGKRPRFVWATAKRPSPRSGPTDYFVLSTTTFSPAPASVVAFVIVALAQIAKANQLNEVARALWVLIVIVAPVAGALAFFWIGSRQRRSPISGHS
jgi:hypothetical protein